MYGQRCLKEDFLLGHHPEFPVVFCNILKPSSSDSLAEVSRVLVLNIYFEFDLFFLFYYLQGL